MSSLARVCGTPFPVYLIIIGAVEGPLDIGKLQ